MVVLGLDCTHYSKSKVKTGQRNNLPVKKHTFLLRLSVDSKFCKKHIADEL